MSPGGRFILHKVELHIHVDGAVRAATIWELSKKKGLKLPGDGSLKALEEELVVKTPCQTLCDFLSKFQWIAPPICGDLDAIERIAYELCEDKAKDGVVYMEMRGSPHLLIPEGSAITPREVLTSYLKGVRRGEKDFGVKARFIVCCMRGLPDTAREVVDLCEEFKNDGVVGIDVAGDEAMDVDESGEERFHHEIIDAFQDAHRRGIHRTVHAGEDGPANGVLKAIELLKAERIGHGYHVHDDASVYAKAKSAGIHFETCPISSMMTGAVKAFDKHPIVRFAEENANFSVNTDDPTITNGTLTDEYNLLIKWGATAAQIKQANINAIKAAFISQEEKNEILQTLNKN